MSRDRIDAHQHFWLPSRGDYGWLTPELGTLYREFGPSDLRPLREAVGVTRTVVVQAAPTIDETRYLLDLCRDEPSVAGVIGWVPLDAPDAATLIDEFAREPKFKGVRPMLQDLADDHWIEQTTLDPAIRALIDHDLSFDALIFTRHMKSLRMFAERHPELRIVIDHGAKPPLKAASLDEWTAWANGISALAELRSASPTSGRLYCKLSGLATEAAPGWTLDTLRPTVDHLIDTFGAERLMWGSDWPVLNLNGDYVRWFDTAWTLTERLGAAQQHAIFGATASAFYRL